jgi:hypothetical protein
MIGKDFTLKDCLEPSKIRREHNCIKAARKALDKRVRALRKRLNAYNKKARRERCAHYAAVLRIKP